MGIEIAAGLAVAGIVFVGGLAGALIWAILFCSSGDIPSRVQEGNALLIRGKLAEAEPIVLKLLKDAPQCDCVQELATEYYQLLLAEVLKLPQTENNKQKAVAARQSCLSHASEKALLGSISPRRRALGGYCEPAINFAAVSKPETSKPSRGKASQPPPPSEQAETDAKALGETLAEHGLPNGELNTLPERNVRPELRPGETAEVADDRGGVETEVRERDACKTPPVKGREERVAECPGAPAPAAKPAPQSVRRQAAGRSP